VAPPNELQVNAGVVWLAGNTVWSTPDERIIEVRFSGRCAIQIDVYLTLPYTIPRANWLQIFHCASTSTKTGPATVWASPRATTPLSAHCTMKCLLCMRRVPIKGTQRSLLAIQAVFIAYSIHNGLSTQQPTALCVQTVPTMCSPTAWQDTSHTGCVMYCVLTSMLINVVTRPTDRLLHGDAKRTYSAMTKKTLGWWSHHQTGDAVLNSVADCDSSDSWCAQHCFTVCCVCFNVCCKVTNVSNNRSKSWLYQTQLTTSRYSDYT